MNFPFFIARRLYRGEGAAQGRRNASVPAIRIATAGVALGLAVMLVSVCGVRGFKQEISRKVVGFGAHLEIMDVNTFRAPESSPVYSGEDFIRWVEQRPGVAHAQRVSQKMGILKTETDFQGITLRGAGREYDWSFIEEHLVEGKIPDFSDGRGTDRIVLSRRQAQNLGLRVGDRIYAYFFENTVKTRRFEVAGIYETNLAQFDKTIALTDLRTVNKLNGWPDSVSTEVEVRLRDFRQLAQAADDLSAALNGSRFRRANGPSVITVKEHYPQIFSWLGLLDLNVWVILALMVCVAGFTMISGLLILILERTGTIGILKAMGACNTSIRRVFLHFAVFIIGKGLLWGNLIGLGLIGIQKQWGLVKLDPATYYVDTVPVEVNVPVILLLNLGTLLLTALALIGPSFMISRIQPAKAIRFE